MGQGSEIARGLRRFLDDSYTSVNRCYPIPFEEGLRLMDETAAAYDANAHSLVAVGCRSVVESACYLYFGTRWLGTGWDYRELPSKLNGDLREIRFGELLEALNAESGFPRSNIEKVVRIQYHGNFVAHLASRLLREDLAETRGKAVAAVKGRSNRKAGVGPPARKEISKAEALQDLVDTAQIVKELVRLADSRCESPWPEG